MRTSHTYPIARMNRTCVHLLRGIITIPNQSRTSLHTSSVLPKERKIFYNKYIGQLRRRKRIYTGYAYDVLDDQRRRIESHDEDTHDTDFQEELIAEGRKRWGSYSNSKRMQLATKGAGPRLLTWQQMEHIRFLRQEDPEEWDVHTLAHSFQVPEMVIRKVLRNKKVLSPWLQEKLDKKARANHRISNSAPDSSSSSKAVTITDERISTQEQWGLPEWKNLGWFAGYENAKLTADTKPEKNIAKSSSATGGGVTWLGDDECEFYEELYQVAEAMEDEHLDSDTADDTSAEAPDNPFKVTTDNGKCFYDNEGELLYRI